MGLTLTAHNTSEIAEPVTKPYYLIELGFNTPVYYSTLYNVTIDSKSYSASRNVQVKISQPDKSGNARATLVIDNVDNSVSALTLGESPAGLPAKIYAAYASDASLLDLIPIIDGEMDSTSIDDSSHTVTLKLIGSGSEKLSPGLFIGPPDCNHLPPPGSQIVSGNTTITLSEK